MKIFTPFSNELQSYIDDIENSLRKLKNPAKAANIECIKGKSPFPNELKV